MHYIGIDLHKRSVVIAVLDEAGHLVKEKKLSTIGTHEIVHFFKQVRKFRAVIEASGSYRWLYDLLRPLGDVILAHPLKLKAIVAGRAKTDKLDALMLAKLLRGDLIPQSYVPGHRYQQLRDLTRSRARLVRHQTQAKNEIHALMNCVIVWSTSKKRFFNWTRTSRKSPTIFPKWKP